jgi:hypothetical protein
VNRKILERAREGNKKRMEIKTWRRDGKRAGR